MPPIRDLLLRDTRERRPTRVWDIASTPQAPRTGRLSSTRTGARRPNLLVPVLRDTREKGPTGVWDVAPTAEAPRTGRLSSARTGAGGLTLLEMLVVMVLVTLLGTLLLQGIGFFTGKYQVVQRARADLSLAELQQHWFATSVRGLTPYGVEARRFVGDARAFRGITLTPLQAEPGMPVTARWTIDGEDASMLRYAEDGGLPLTVLPGNGERLVFDYADAAHRWYDRWPVEAAEGEWTPTYIRLRAEGEGPLWLARVQADPAPLLTEAALR